MREQGELMMATRKPYSSGRLVRKLTAADRLLDEGKQGPAVYRELRWASYLVARSAPLRAGWRLRALFGHAVEQGDIEPVAGRTRVSPLNAS